MPVIQLDKGHNFKRDRRLSWKARGILAYLLDHEEAWEVTMQDLIEQSDEDGRIAVQHGMQELVALRYAKLVPIRNAQGRVTGKKYIVYSAPYDTDTDRQVSRQSQNLPVGTEKHENRQSQNLLVGESEKLDAVIDDHRQAGFPSVIKTVCHKTCPITKDLKPKKDLREEKDSSTTEEKQYSYRARKPRTTTRPAKRVPPTWVLTPDLREWAAAEVPGVNIDYETNKFRDHNFKTAHTDWNATWRNWMRYAWERLPAEAQRQPTTPTTAAKPIKVVL